MYSKPCYPTPDNKYVRMTLIVIRPVKRRPDNDAGRKRQTIFDLFRYLDGQIMGPIGNCYLKDL